MYALSKKSKGLAVAAGLALTLSACGSNDENVGTDAGAGTSSEAPSAEASPLAQLDSLTGESTSVKLDPAFLEGITGLKVAPATIGTATLEGDVLSFPITGGNATYYEPGSRDPYVESEINHDGSGLQLTGPNGKVVKLENFVVDAGTSMLTGKVTVDDAVFAESAPLFFLDGSTLNPLDTTSSAGQGILQGTTVSLTKTAADALNATFEITALTEFFPVGVATITLDLPA